MILKLIQKMFSRSEAPPLCVKCVHGTKRLSSSKELDCASPFVRGHMSPGETILVSCRFARQFDPCGPRGLCFEPKEGEE